MKSKLLFSEANFLLCNIRQEMGKEEFYYYERILDWHAYDHFMIMILLYKILSRLLEMNAILLATNLLLLLKVQNRVWNLCTKNLQRGTLKYLQGEFRLNVLILLILKKLIIHLIWWHIFLGIKATFSRLGYDIKEILFHIYIY